MTSQCFSCRYLSLSQNSISVSWLAPAWFHYHCTAAIAYAGCLGSVYLLVWIGDQSESFLMWEPFTPSRLKCGQKPEFVTVSHMNTRLCSPISIIKAVRQVPEQLPPSITVVSHNSWCAPSSPNLSRGLQRLFWERHKQWQRQSHVLEGKLDSSFCDAAKQTSSGTGQIFTHVVD